MKSRRFTLPCGAEGDAIRKASSSSMSGFTLIEVMITLLLFSVVIAALFSSIVVIGRAQAAAQRIDVAQSGVRAALDLITRDVEMASAGARSGTITQGTGTPTTVSAITVTDSTTGADRIDLVLVDPTAQATVLASYGAGQNVISVDNIINFNVGDQIQISDLTTATILKVTGFGNSGGNPTIVVVTPSNALPKTYPAGCYVFRSRSVSYFVDTTTFSVTPGLDPILMKDPDGPNGPLAPQPLAEGIEDFQVALGFDFNGNGVLTNVGSFAGDDSWVFNVAGETAPASLTQLRAVRVTLVARTTSALTGTRGTRPAAEDRPAASSSDSFARRVLRSEIAVRNFNL